MGKTLRSEIKQAAPFASLEEEVFLNLVRTTAMLEHSVGEWFRPYGLTQTQYNVLRILRGAGGEGLCRSEVRERMLAPVPDTTRLLDRLADLGLVVRQRSGSDRRFVTTRITKRGLDLLAEIDAPLKAMHVRHLGHMARSDLRRLSELLSEARERV